MAKKPKSAGKSKAKTPKQMRMNDLIEIILDPDQDPRDYIDYFKVEVDAHDITPTVRPNPMLVEPSQVEGDVAVKVLNGIFRWRRKNQYKARRRKWPDGLMIVSEGDSWFQYPLLLCDVIDQLYELREDYLIRGLGAAGDLVSLMRQSGEMFEAAEDYQPAFMLLSGGGNDLVGDARLSRLLPPYDGTRAPEAYIDETVSQAIGEIFAEYDQIIARMRREHPDTKLILHGYGWAIPRRRGVWLGKPLLERGVPPQELLGLGREIIRALINRFNDRLAQYQADHAGAIFHVDARPLVRDDQWYDELHPTDDGYRAVAEAFAQIIDRHRPARAAVAGAELAPGPILRSAEPLCPGQENFLVDEDLSQAMFKRLVMRRNRAIVHADGRMAGFDSYEDATERREAEHEIELVLEKIDQLPDFEPARFLADGARCSEAVCRIRVPDLGTGTGFLIAARGLIMTNNHVLPNRFIAEEALAEFGYEDGGITRRVALLPDRVFLTDKALDYTIVACAAEQVTDIPPIPLRRDPLLVTRREPVNIIQHPRGRRKEVAIRNNDVTRVKQRVLCYRTDTEPGSSGSPVLNCDWQLVALHRAGMIQGERAENQGTLASAIVADILAKRIEGIVGPGSQEVLASVPDTSPLLGFFDIAGVFEQAVEVEVPTFTGDATFADIGFWNIEQFNRSVSDQRIQAVADVMHTLNMDVFGLTEVQKEPMDRLVAAMADRGAAMGYELKDVTGGLDIAILFDKDTTHVTKRPDLADRFQPLLDERLEGKSVFPRWPMFADCAIADDEDNRVELRLIVVHLKAFGDTLSRRRRRRAGQILAQIIDTLRDEDGPPIVLGGDFNDAINTEVFAALRNKDDLIALTVDDQEENAASFIDGRQSLLDHIIVSDDVRLGSIAQDDAAIVRFDRSVRDFAETVSDHVPVVMRVIFGQESRPVRPPEAPPVRVEIPQGSAHLEIGFRRPD